MNTGLRLLKKLKEMLFNKKQKTKTSRSVSKPSLREVSERDAPSTNMPHAIDRTPYFIQIGFDFGTSYSKCICRDVMTDKAWVYISELEAQGTSFLIPSVFLFQNGKLGYIQSSSTSIYQKDGLHHLKLALVKIALKEWDDPVLILYQNAIGSQDTQKLSQFVYACGVYFLAGVLGNVRREIRGRIPDFGLLSDDYMAVNLAVPVADAERPAVNDLYHKTLCEAWLLADQFAGFPKISPPELIELTEKNQADLDHRLKEACYLYPEVSANVQGFVRSRVSSEGLYIFSDTGAGSVDQSIFIFSRRDGKERLNYLSANVLPLGSSRIEHLAASDQTDWQTLEIWRKKKETGGSEPELNEARDSIRKELSKGTESTLARAKKKLYVKEQLNGVRVIFGGGGHCDNPYKIGALKPFSGNLFSKVISPNVVGLPIPRDLELEGQRTRWMHRLSVAYGLSFTQHNLADFMYPRDVDDPRPDEVWKPIKKPAEAPTKDVC